MEKWRYSSIRSKPWHWMQDFKTTQTETNNKDLNFVKEAIGYENVTSESVFIPQLS
jgi:hypothetical protein